jgi:hypothetical protein
MNLTSTPNLLQFETNTNCNGKCTFCEHQNMTPRKPAKWSDLIELMYWIVPQAKEVCPFGMQEPLLDNKFGALLSNIKQFNMKAKTTVYTNMTVYNKEAWTQLIKQQCLDSLCISFYGTTKHVYNKLQPRLDYVRVQKNIKSLMKLKKQLGWRLPLVSLHLMITPDTVKDANRFLKKWNPIVDQVGFVRYDGWCGKQPYTSEYEDQVWGPAEKLRVPCHRLWTSMVVHCDGTMVPCCLDSNNEMPLTDAFVKPQEAFNCEKMQDLRKLHLEGRQEEISLCRDCTVWRHDTPPEWIEYWEAK